MTEADTGNQKRLADLNPNLEVACLCHRFEAIYISSAF